MPVEGDSWYISRLIGIERSTGNIPRILWDSMGQNASTVLWVPTDGSKEILVAAQDSLYSNLPGFWPSIYRVDISTGRKRLVEKGRTHIMNWGADHLGRVRYGIGYRDEKTRSTLLYRGNSENKLRAVAQAEHGADEQLTLPFYFVPDSEKGYIFRDIANGRSVIVEIDVPIGETLRMVYAPDDADVESVLLGANGSKLLGIWTNDRSAPLRWLDPVMAAHQKKLEKASPNSQVTIESYSHDQSKCSFASAPPIIRG